VAQWYPPADAGEAGDSGLIPGLGDLLEKEMVTHSSILAWEIPWTTELGGLQSIVVLSMDFILKNIHSFCSNIAFTF